MSEHDDWYDDIAESPEEERRAKVLALVEEALRLHERPVTVRTLAIDFEDRTVSIGGRKYGPITERGFAAPLVDTTALIMPSRDNEPW